MGMSLTYRELRKISDEELIDQHDKEAKYTVVGTSYYLEELARRDSQRVNDSMLRCTKWITVMTAVMLLATVVNVFLALFR
ncbi:hypothetical protein VJ918_00615 [Adlercreutzia sp. R21]|uniref:hypothetical protein n=1 Tax=Adlercreutzia wanghongyangiae TaxID=3111451 RepID=UPI002DBC2838|nr:hypothetical protein [Adlercreutzia sp. R21]MEC4183307.1 hypothetical protein [Adlercreutzia sp. R21]